MTNELVKSADGHNCKAFLQAYREVWYHGKPIAPHGVKCKEWENARIGLDMLGSPVTAFHARGLNLKYAKQEFLWYLRGDRYDDSILQHATMWKKLKQPDGGFNSNYGQYMFPSQFDWVCRQLCKDPDSRQASIVLLTKEHLIESNTDVVCTYAINFRVRNDYLNMTVHMRSNDIIFGMTNDVFCFAMLYRLVFGVVGFYSPHLRPGGYTHLVDSLHVYERHYEMIEKIVTDGGKSFQPIEVPWASFDEVRSIMDCTRKAHRSDVYGPLTQWLNSD